MSKPNFSRLEDDHRLTLNLWGTVSVQSDGVMRVGVELAGTAKSLRGKLMIDRIGYIPNFDDVTAIEIRWPQCIFANPLVLDAFRHPFDICIESDRSRAKNYADVVYTPSSEPWRDPATCVIFLRGRNNAFTDVLSATNVKGYLKVPSLGTDLQVCNDNNDLEMKVHLLS